MVSLPRPLVRNSLFILVTIVVVVCIQDSVLTLLKTIKDLHRFRNDEPVRLDPDKKTGNFTARKLVLLQMLFRHGHRAPFILYPNDPNSILDWKDGLSMLTQLGRLQHYAMGIHLQNRYRGFITTNPREVEMSNSDNFRCQYGVYAFIAGLYAPTKEYSFTDEIRWQPIISRHHNSGGKFILTRNSCNISDYESLALRSSKEGGRVLKHYKNLYNFWSKNSGRLIDNWVLAGDLGKTLACEKDYNFTIPDWALTYWDEFRKQTAISYWFNFGTKLIQRYRVGPLLGYMIENMEKKILDNESEKRVIVFSAHGSNLASILLALNCYNWLGPPHASTMVLELWKNLETDDYSLRWLYFNSSNPERQIDPPVALEIPGCGDQFCPFETFKNITHELIPEDCQAECENESMKAMFKPMEWNTRVPLSSSSAVNFQCFIMILLLFCIYIYSWSK